MLPASIVGDSHRQHGATFQGAVRCPRAVGEDRLMLTNCIVFSCYEQCLPCQLHSRLSHCQSSSKGIACFCCQLSAVVNPAGCSNCKREYSCCMSGLFHRRRAVPEAYVPSVAYICLEVWSVFHLNWLVWIIPAQQGGTPSYRCMCKWLPCTRSQLYRPDINVILVPCGFDSCVVSLRPGTLPSCASGMPEAMRSALQLLRQHDDWISAVPPMTFK